MLSKMPNTLHCWLPVWPARTNYPNETVSTIKECSVNVAHFINLHFDIIDKESFRDFTKIDSLPIISAEVVVMLMEQEQRLCLDEINDSDGDGLTCIQHLCIGALYDRETREWQVSNANALQLQEELRKLHPTGLESLLLRALEPKNSTQGENPKSISVSGARYESANGSYVHSGCHGLTMGKVESLQFTLPKANDSIIQYACRKWLEFVQEFLSYL